jgi:hypothetical protein
MSMLEDFRFMRGKRGSDKLDSGQMKTRNTQEFTQVWPLEGKDLRPACLTLY